MWKWYLFFYPVNSVQFSRSAISDSVQRHGLQHTRLPCPLATPGACSNSRPSNQWCQPTVSHPLSSASPPALIFPSIMVFSSVSVLHIKWPKYWSFSFSISPSSEYSGLISFRIDWFDQLLLYYYYFKNLKVILLQKARQKSKPSSPFCLELVVWCMHF